ncbi:anti-sigma factor [Filimonas lacunae]|nr:anti-sigma factor [Filimonas lacunae]
MYYQYCYQLYHISYSIVRSESRSRQALQAIFLDIWRDRDALEGVFNVPAYLHVLLCKHLLDGGTTGEEVALLEARIVENEEELPAEKSMLTLSPQEADVLYAKITSRLHGQQRSLQWKYMLVAVVVTGIIGAGAFWFNGYYNAFHTYATKAGEHRTFILPDGSKVRLYGKSMLRLAGGYGDKRREMELKGAGVFEVKHDSARSFIVHTVAMEINDADSTFQIRSYPEELADITANISGKARVTLKRRNKSRAIYHLEAMQKLVVMKQPAEEDSETVDPRVELLDSCHDTTVYDNLH